MKIIIEDATLQSDLSYPSFISFLNHKFFIFLEGSNYHEMDDEGRGDKDELREQVQSFCLLFLLELG